MFRYTLRDESNHIELFRRLLLELVAENPEIWTPAFREELRELMREAVALEKQFIRDCLPVERGRALGARSSSSYIDYIADRRLEGVGLAPLRRRRREPAALARRADGHPQGAELLRGPRHRVPEVLRRSPLVADDEL